MNTIQKFGKQANDAGLRLTLCDINADMTDMWLDQFFGVVGVEILQGDLLEAAGDAIVSPANSFGDMSGGIDKHIDDFFGGAAQEQITQAIRDQFMGELPVGMGLVVPMSNHRIPFVVVAPTMRVPQPVPNSLNAYLAMRAALVAVARYNAQKPEQSAALRFPAYVPVSARCPVPSPLGRCALPTTTSSGKVGSRSSIPQWLPSRSTAKV